MQKVAQVWLVYRRTQSTLFVGTLGFCWQIPVLVLGPLGGLTADRFPWRKLVIVARLTFLAPPVLLAALTLTDTVNVGLLLGLALSWGAINARSIPARQAREAKLVQVVAWSTVWIVVAQCVYAASPLFVLSMAASAGLGYCIFRQLSVTSTLIQSSIDDRFRRQVMSLYSMTVVGITPLGNLAAGAEVAGVRVRVTSGAAVGAGAALLWRRQITGRIEE